MSRLLVVLDVGKRMEFWRVPVSCLLVVLDVEEEETQADTASVCLPC